MSLSHTPNGFWMRELNRLSAVLGFLRRGSGDNALAETINGLYKAKVIHRRRSWKSFEAVEWATLQWV